MLDCYKNPEHYRFGKNRLLWEGIRLHLIKWPISVSMGLSAQYTVKPQYNVVLVAVPHALGFLVPFKGNHNASTYIY